MELRGGKVKAPTLFKEADAEQRAIHLVGFLSQRDGSMLRIFDAAGTVVATKEFGENPLATSPISSSSGPTCSSSGESGKIIQIRPSKRFRYMWESFESEGVQPTFASRDNALDYAKTRFGGSSGEIHVYDENGETVTERIPIR